MAVRTARAVLITLAAVGLGLTLGPMPTHIPACPTEDSTDCFWDASTQGNGLGQSFVDIEGSAYYLP